MKSLRTKETEEKYKSEISKGLNNTCFFCNKEAWDVISEFNYFVLVNNDFPYDAVASDSHILFPKRHIQRDSMNDEELKELESIKNNYLVQNDYNYILEGITKISIPGHYHLHPIKLKEI